MFVHVRADELQQQGFDGRDDENSCCDIKQGRVVMIDEEGVMRIGVSSKDCLRSVEWTAVFAGRSAGRFRWLTAKAVCQPTRKASAG